VITEIPLSKYLVDLIITLVQRCMDSSEFGDIVFEESGILRLDVGVRDPREPNLVSILKKSCITSSVYC